jgi:hypothetical protein
VSDSREQQLRGFRDVEVPPIDFDEVASLVPAWDRQQSPSSLIEQWLSPITLVGAVRQPVRQFKPPHQSKSRIAKW